MLHSYVVEDEKDEYQKALAENGRVATEMFRDHDEWYYDAILMDMRMPEMDGLEATKTIRAMDRADASGIPIIALFRTLEDLIAKRQDPET